jgi:hypothetical protein
MTVAASAPESQTEKGKPVAEKGGWPQQPVISIRISDALRSRLERLKELLSKKSGDIVTTSEVAKQLLESAREDRLEVAELLSNATVALAAARHKAEAGLSLSRAEWIVLALRLAMYGGERGRDGMPTTLRICRASTRKGNRSVGPRVKGSIYRPRSSG